jgi:hypothetical protein
MPDAPNTPIAPDAQVFHDNPDVQTLLTFALAEREVKDAWLMIDALLGLECLTLEQAWDALSSKIAREFE